ncbi:MAG: hypothetical protein M3011_07635 [Actinomycetota bacterium]|nr:hypothetical protein [Actinomycetota bacterium]
MDIEEFYDADERRRTSDELQFGQDWHDVHGRRYELNWIADTGELYVMQDDPPMVWADPFGDVVSMPVAPDHLGVRVLAVIADGTEIEGLLDGWEQAMTASESVSWLTARLQSRG